MNFIKTRTRLAASLVAACMICGGFIAEAGDHISRIPSLKGEKWWGCTVALGEKMPFAANTEPEDISLDNRNNQVVPLMLSSAGRYIWSDEPFEFHFVNDTLTIKSSHETVAPVSGGKTLRDAYLAASGKHFPPSGEIPEAEFFSKPQYNTWIELMYNQNQADIEKYASDVLKHAFPTGIFMIDDNWQKYYGNFEFKPERFASPERMCSNLHKRGFKVMLWLSPFISADCPEYREAAKKGYLVKTPSGSPAIVKWWNGYSACYDLTNPEAADHLEAELKKAMSGYGVDGFKFDGGDVTLMASKSENLVFHEKDADPNVFSQRWAEFALRFPFNELRACYKLGGKPLVQRLGDKTYAWSSVGKLIPEMLTAGLLGYPYTCPDMIGGGEFSSFLDIDYSSIDQDLIVRSCQIHSMMPMMQFSVAPWRILDTKHLEICRKYAKWHEELGPYILEMAEKAAETGEPIVRFMEYAFPHQGFAECKDQFMLGDKYLVAPVTDAAFSRYVSLPKGKWKDDRGDIHVGPCVIKTDVPIERLPYYVRLSDIVSPIPGQIAVGWGNTDTRYPQHYSEIGDLSVLTRTLTLSAWRGEEVYAQALVCSEKDIDCLSVEAGELRSGKAVIPSSAVETGFVGFVMTDEINEDGCGGCGERINSEFDSSYVADQINYIERSLSMKKGSAHPVWVKINVPRDVQAGTYRGKISFMSGGKSVSDLNIDIEVSEHTLPAENPFHLDLWQNPYAVSRYYDVEPFSDEHFALMRPIMKQYADAGGKVITTSIMHKPWNGQTYDPFESMVTWLKKADGSWWFDYTVFDKWVEFMMSLGVDSQINCYSMIPWRLSFQYFDQAANAFRFLSAKPGEPEYEQFWTVMLRSFASHLKEKGWFDITMIAMDERPMQHMLDAVSVIKKADPDFKIAFAGNCHEELLDVLDYYCIPMEQNFPEGAVERRRKNGMTTTWYTSCAEAWPNTFTFSGPAQAEWMGWYIAAKGLDGYLRWAYNSWPADPMNDSRFTSWAAGDTYLVYPDGISSIRFERLKAGITAFRKIAVLKAEFAENGDSASLQKLNQALSLFVMPDIDFIRHLTKDPDAEDYAANAINAAKQILNTL